MKKRMTVYKVEYEWVDNENEEGVMSSLIYITPAPIETCYEQILNRICQKHKSITWEGLFTCYFDMTISIERTIEG